MKKTKDFTEEDKKRIAESYITDISTTCVSLGKKYGATRDTISYILQKQGIKIRNDLSKLKRKYTLNESFFEKIDSEEKAYFLGLLYADGYMDWKHKILGISLQDQDAYLLEKFRILLGSNKSLVFRTWPNHPTWKNSCVMQVYGIKICEDVKKLGCIPKKSLTLNFPTKQQVPYKLISHFLRGYFDGDGSLGNSITIISSLSFVTVLTKMLLQKGIESVIYDMNCNKITKCLSINKKNSGIKFLDWIYKDATIYMERKYKKYLDYRAKFIHLLD